MTRSQNFVLVFLLAGHAMAGGWEAAVKPFAGYTMVDVGKAAGIPDDNLEDWEQISYGGLLQGLYHLRNGFEVGPEFGYQYLYYWEESYVYSTYRQYRWGNVETLHLGCAVRNHLNRWLYFMGGVNMRYFMDGSGVTPGFFGSLGSEINLTPRITIPLEVRLDIVLGNDVPKALNIAVGVSYDFGVTE